MKFNVSQMAVLAVGAAVTLTAHSASAAVESQVIDYGSASSPVAGGNTVDLTFNTFNSSLGTLAGATVTLTSVDTVQSVVFDFNGGAGTYSDAMTAGGMETVNSTLDGLSTSTSSLSAGPFAGSIPAGTPAFGQVVVGSATQTLTASAAVAPGNLSLYTGGTGDFMVSVVTGTAHSSFSTPTPGLEIGWNANSYGNVEVDYTYLPSVAVPEPGTIFAGLGLLGYVGVVIMRRNFTVHSAA
jgi:hypothetical protein